MLGFKKPEAAKPSATLDNLQAAQFVAADLNRTVTNAH